MRGKIERGASLRRDLLHVFDNLSRSGPKVADRFLDAAERTFGRIAEMPGLGEACEPEEFGIIGLRRSLVSGFKNHVVYYLPIEGGVRVLRVVHGSRDATVLLDAEEMD